MEPRIENPIEIVKQMAEGFQWFAHELRNPLTAIMANIELLQEMVRNSTDRHELNGYVDSIYHSSRQIAGIIEELDSYAHYQKIGELNSVRECSINEILTTSYEIYRSIAIKKKITFELNAHQVPHLQLDRTSIMEAMDNLITNALKFTSPGGNVLLEAEHDSNLVFVHVTDSGQGLTNEDKRRIFVQFGKLSAKPTNGEGSRGIGLYMTRRIIELHGGKIWVDSEKTKGSRFSFCLPRSPEE